MIINIRGVIRTKRIGHANRITGIGQGIFVSIFPHPSVEISIITGIRGIRRMFKDGGNKTTHEKDQYCCENCTERDQENGDQHPSNKHRFAQVLMQSFPRLLSLITILTISRSVIRWRFMRGWWYIRHTILLIRLYNVSSINSVRYFLDLTTLSTVSLSPLIIGAVA